MRIYEEQMEQRRKADNESLADALQDLAAAATQHHTYVGQDNNQRLLSAIEQVFRYYNIKYRDISTSAATLDDKVECLCQPHGMMHRNVKLDKDWYKHATGAMLGFLKDDTPVALIPGMIKGYFYFDPATGKKIRLNKKSVQTLQEDAICFYRPFPQKKLGIPDLLKYILQCIPLSQRIVLIIMMGITMLVGMISPKITYILYNNVIPSKSIRVLCAAGIFMIFTNISILIFGIIQNFLSTNINVQISISVQAATMARLISLPANFFRQFSSGELSNRAQQLNTLCTTLSSTFVMSGITALFSLAYIGQIFVYAPALVVPSLIMTAITIGFTLLNTKIRMNEDRQVMNVAGEESSMTYSMITGIQKIKLAGAEKRVFSRWARLYTQEVRHTYNRPKILQLSSAFSMIISLSSTVIMYYFAIQSGVTVAEYNAFTASYGMVSGAFFTLANMANTAATFRPVLERVRPVMQATPENGTGKKAVNRIKGRVELSHVSFRYSETMPAVLDDISMQIHAGEYVAIVGKTGCGKSTLVRILLGFEKPQKGAVYYDGRDIQTLNLRSLRQHIGTVMQDGKLFQGSIYENIIISTPDATMDDAWNAAELAGIADDIREMPMGMYTMISEGAGGISGGQKQRLMIARAIVSRPNLLIFDEATSALDNITQKKVSQSLNSLQCTRIVIAHRLSTIRQCDRILVLDGGHIIEDGTYDELMAQNGFFASLVERQKVS